MKLNIGAGATPREGYLSVDIQGGDITAEAWDLPCDDDSVDAIYSRHMIEHVTPKQAGDCLREWVRVLKPGGVCRVICPDRDRVLRDIGNYHIDPTKGKTYHLCAMHSLYGWQRDEYDFHKWAWNETELRELMKAAGLHSIARLASDDLDLAGAK